MLRIVLTLVMFGILIVGGALLFQYASQDKGVVKSARDKVVEITDPNHAPLIQLMEKERVIIVTGSGYEPETLAVWPFDEVFWVNQTSETITIEVLADEEDGSPSFILNDIPPGQSKSTYFAYQGRFRYRDRYHPERIGFLTIE